MFVPSRNHSTTAPQHHSTISQASRPDSFLAGNGAVRGLACPHLRPLPACRGGCLGRQVHRLARLRQYSSIDPSPPVPRRGRRGRRGRWRRRISPSPDPRRGWRRRISPVSPTMVVVSRAIVARRGATPMAATVIMANPTGRGMGKSRSGNGRTGECDCAHEGQNCLCRLVHDSPSLSFTCMSHILVRR